MPKRKRSESSTPSGSGSGGNDDPARKYCLTKLQETFGMIFLKYPFFPAALGEGEAHQEELVEKTEELTEEEKTAMEEKAKKYATELEECIFETYSEVDAKSGKNAVAMKYK